MIPKAFFSLALVAGLVSCSTIPQIPLDVRPDPEEEAPCFMAKFRPKGLHSDPCHHPNQMQCGIAELRWSKGVGPYSLSILIDPSTHPLSRPPQGTTQVITNITETSYPVVFRGLANGGVYVNLTDAIGGRVTWEMLILPSSDSSCLE